jgi:hypothetical protein
MLLHHVQPHVLDRTVEPLTVERLEQELDVSIPSRTGRRASSRYRFLAYVDAINPEGGGVWLVEFKLRGALQPVEMIQLSRQIRWYAWAYQRWSGQRVLGVLVDERLNEVPKPPRMVQGRKKDEAKVPSHAKDQHCTADDYVAVCHAYGVPVQEATRDALAARKWHQRVPIQFREGELVEAGTELVAAAKLIGQLDSGELYPVRNSRPGNCNGCRYKAICPNPRDELYLDDLYERRPPKRDLDSTLNLPITSTPTNGQLPEPQLELERIAA